MFLIFLAFYFEIILDLQQNCKNRSDGFCTPFNYLPLMLFFFFSCTGSSLWCKVLSSCGTWALLPCSMWESLLPNQGSNLPPLYWKADS